MPKQCLIHSFYPDYQLRSFSYFDISGDKTYLKEDFISFRNSELYLSLKKNSDSKVSCYFSGDYLNQLSYKKKEIDTLKSLVDKGKIELLLGTYHHSFSCLLSSKLFTEEIHSHRNLINELLAVEPSGFYNTLSIYSDELIPILIKEKIIYTSAPRVAWFTGTSSGDRIFNSQNNKLQLILVGESKEDRDLIIGYSSGQQIAHSNLEAVTANEAVTLSDGRSTYNMPTLTGIDPQGEDLHFYLGNSLQKQAFNKIKELIELTLKTKNRSLTDNLLKLASPEIFKRLNQRYPERYEEYTTLMNCLADLELKTR